MLHPREWLTLWDNVLAEHPAFLLFAAVAFLSYNRISLLSAKMSDDVQGFLSQPHAVHMAPILKRARQLFAAFPMEHHPCNHLRDFVPLTPGQYPILAHLPSVIVNFEISQRDKIRREEQELLAQRRTLDDVSRETRRLELEEQAWRQQQAVMEQAELERKQRLQEEERIVQRQRQRLAAMRREQELQQLKMLETSKRLFMERQSQQREAELRRLDEELEKRETESTLAEVELKALEIQGQKAKLELELSRQQVSLAQLRGSELSGSRTLHSPPQREVVDSELRDSLRAVQRHLAAAEARMSRLQTVSASPEEDCV